MKIYFCGSIRGGRQDADLYMRIIEQLKSYGEVLTEHVGYVTLDEAAKLPEKDIHDRDCGWLQEADAVVAEVTQPSLGVGYELGRAVAWDKRILCLYRPENGKSLSAMIRGAHNDKDIVVKDYVEEDVPGLLKNFFALSCMIRGADNGKDFFVKDYVEEDVPGLLKQFFKV